MFFIAGSPPGERFDESSADDRSQRHNLDIRKRRVESAGSGSVKPCLSTQTATGASVACNSLCCLGAQRTVDAEMSRTARSTWTSVHRAGARIARSEMPTRRSALVAIHARDANMRRAFCISYRHLGGASAGSVDRQYGAGSGRAPPQFAGYWAVLDLVEHAILGGHRWLASTRSDVPF